MLYDPSWEKPAVSPKKAFAKKALVAWIKKQDPNEAYDYEDTTLCLLGRYFSDCGWTNVSLGNVSITCDQAGYANVPRAFQNIAYPKPHTFGAALKRSAAR